MPAITVTWKLPDDSGASLIRGFDVRVEGQKRGYRCIVIELEDEIKTSGVSFNGVLTSMEQNKNYVITLQSLPRNNASGMLEKYVTTPECAANNSGSWTISQFNITYDHVTERLHVAFKGPPKRFGFEEFSLSVWSMDFTVMEDVQIYTTYHTFENIKPGEYDIMLRPHDPYFQQEGKCKCRDKRDICSSCTMTEVKYVAEPRVAESTVQSGPQKTVLVGGMTAAGLASLLIVIAMIIGRKWIVGCMFSQRRELKDGTEGVRLLIVFIDTTEESNNAKKKTKLAIEKYKERIQKETNFLVCGTILTSNDMFCSSLESEVNKCAGSICNPMSQTSKETFLTLKDVGDTKKETSLVNKTSIVCCLALTDGTSGDRFEHVRKATGELGKKWKLTNIALRFSKTSAEKVSAWHDLKCFAIPDEHKKLLEYMNSGIARSHDTSHTSKSAITGSCDVAVTVDTDTEISQDNSNGAYYNGVKTSQMELLSRLEVPWPSRERYVSNDSGRCESVESCRCSPLEDTSDENENGCLVSEQYLPPYTNVPATNMCDSKDFLRCPSDVYFAPPEPSEISETDIVDTYRSYCDREKNGYMPMSNIMHTRKAGYVCPCTGSCGKIQDRMSRNTNTVAKSDDYASMDAIMSKMAAINARSLYALEAGAKTGETYSVFEGSV